MTSLSFLGASEQLDDLRFLPSSINCIPKRDCCFCAKRL